MEESKVFGIPLVLLFLVFGIAALILIPIIFLHVALQSSIHDLKDQVTVYQQTNLKQVATESAVLVSPSPELTPSPSPSVKPVRVVPSPSVEPVSTPVGEVVK